LGYPTEKVKVVLENEEILLRLLNDSLNVNKDTLKVQTEVVVALRELTESIQEIAYKMPYFE
tara:strand:+ start:566 stop:751 length:186 start_codon:yes stop_codon:yes gene_type:complete